MCYHFFFAAKIPDRFVIMARAMGVDTDALPEEERPLAFIKPLLKLQ
jgi:alcohol dehydrogenase